MKAVSNIQTKENSAVVAEPGGSTPLIPKPAIGHNPEPVRSTSIVNTFLPNIHLISSDILLGHPNGRFPRALPINILYGFLVSLILS